MRDWTDSGESGAVLTEGILGGTPIATAQGWRLVETLLPGERVLTFEAGMQPLASARRACVSAADVPPVFWPLRVPPGALDNRGELLLLPEQKILIESDAAEALLGDPFAMIPAAALEGWRGIARTRPADASLVMSLGFAEDQIIYASRAALLACPGELSPWAPLFDLMEDRAEQAAYVPLSLSQARHLVACLIAEDLGAALRTVV
jgi:hypothetical protein